MNTRYVNPYTDFDFKKLLEKKDNNGKIRGLVGCHVLRGGL